MTVRTAVIPLPATAAPRRLPAQVYLRRRLAAVGVILAIVLGSIVLARAASVALADRGGVPASAAAVRSGGEVVSTAGGAYLAQPGDTLWSIAVRFHGAASLGWYVDELVELNGSASIEAGQQIVLP